MGARFRQPSGEVPPAPRVLGADGERDSALHGRLLRLFGGIWAAIGVGVGALMGVVALATGVLGLFFGTAVWGAIGSVGGILWLLGKRQQRIARTLYRDGVEAHGEVTEVRQLVAVSVNGRHPWQVVYDYVGEDGRTRRGTAIFRDERPRAEVGQRIVVLHDPAHPSRCVLWSRLDAAEPAATNARVAADPPRRIAETIDEGVGAIDAAVEEELAAREEPRARR
jgi:uncharacterized protein DUF3592